MFTKCVGICVAPSAPMCIGRDRNFFFVSLSWTFISICVCLVRCCCCCWAVHAVNHLISLEMDVNCWNYDLPADLGLILIIKLLFCVRCCVLKWTIGHDKFNPYFTLNVDISSFFFEQRKYIYCSTFVGSSLNYDYHLTTIDIASLRLPFEVEQLLSHTKAAVLMNIKKKTNEWFNKYMWIVSPVIILNSDFCIES